MGTVEQTRAVDERVEDRIPWITTTATCADTAKLLNALGRLTSEYSFGL